jgi:hypothetical protein
LSKLAIRRQSSGPTRVLPAEAPRSSGVIGEHWRRRRWSDRRLPVKAQAQCSRDSRVDKRPSGSRRTSGRRFQRQLVRAVRVPAIHGLRRARLAGGRSGCPRRSVQLEVTRAPPVKSRFEDHLRTLAQPSFPFSGSRPSRDVGDIPELERLVDVDDLGALLAAWSSARSSRPPHVRSSRE